MIDGLPEREPCSVCGKMQVQYRERRSAARKRGAHQRRSLCTACYNHAVAREVASKTVLPGVVDTQTLVHRGVCVGTCDICGIKPAVWSDPKARTKLCEVCYESEKLKAGSAESGVKTV
ncbi:MAG TPA: hypothetical protein VN429_08675 [Methanospirillum sp.]|uniref:hypothetical protein n=1 Tax=Methanospirillum sp. TaxID=45200 RepID=UPI002C28A370|nr:hypothetical protein [Methanospirillum sp.]HWQ64478.1 hypothetical protein [Methanospirillum sp.]